MHALAQFSAAHGGPCLFEERCVELLASLMFGPFGATTQRKSFGNGEVAPTRFVPKCRVETEQDIQNILRARAVP